MDYFTNETTDTNTGDNMDDSTDQMANMFINVFRSTSSQEPQLEVGNQSNNNIFVDQQSQPSAASCTEHFGIAECQSASHWRQMNEELILELNKSKAAINNLVQQVKSTTSKMEMADSTSHKYREHLAEALRYNEPLKTELTDTKARLQIAIIDKDRYSVEAESAKATITQLNALVGESDLVSGQLRAKIDQLEKKLHEQKKNNDKMVALETKADKVKQYKEENKKLREENARLVKTMEAGGHRGRIRTSNTIVPEGEPAYQFSVFHQLASYPDAFWTAGAEETMAKIELLSAQIGHPLSPIPELPQLMLDQSESTNNDQQHFEMETGNSEPSIQEELLLHHESDPMIDYSNCDEERTLIIVEEGITDANIPSNETSEIAETTHDTAIIDDLPRQDEIEQHPHVGQEDIEPAANADSVKDTCIIASTEMTPATANSENGTPLAPEKRQKPSTEKVTNASNSLKRPRLQAHYTGYVFIPPGTTDAIQYGVGCQIGPKAFKEYRSYTAIMDTMLSGPGTSPMTAVEKWFAKPKQSAETVAFSFIGAVKRHCAINWISTQFRTAATKKDSIGYQSLLINDKKLADLLDALLQREAEWKESISVMLKQIKWQLVSQLNGAQREAVCRWGFYLCQRHPSLDSLATAKEILMIAAKQQNGQGVLNTYLTLALVWPQAFKRLVVKPVGPFEETLQLIFRIALWNLKSKEKAESMLRQCMGELCDMVAILEENPQRGLELAIREQQCQLSMVMGEYKFGITGIETPAEIELIIDILLLLAPYCDRDQLALMVDQSLSSIISWSTISAEESQARGGVARLISDILLISKIALIRKDAALHRSKDILKSLRSILRGPTTDSDQAFTVSGQEYTSLKFAAIPLLAVMAGLRKKYGKSEECRSFMKDLLAEPGPGLNSKQNFSEFHKALIQKY